MEQTDWRKVLRNFGIELAIYAVLILIYFLLVLRYLIIPLATLFYTNPSLYAVVSLFLIVVQAVVLEAVTSYLVKRLGLERLD